MKRLRTKPAGFTLVEMLIATALVLFILALFTTLFQTATQGVRDAKGINAIDQRLRNAVTMLKTDLRQIYLENNGTRFSPGELFTAANRIPTAGYFSLEENDRALAQGVDEFGNKTEVDYDDVLRMTVARRGDTPSEMFLGRAGAGYSNCTVNGAPVDVGTYLDSLWRSPASRFDVPANQMTSSRFAEVIYFARPQAETPQLGEMFADPQVFGTPQAQDISMTPKVMTLYRRQLLVLNDDAMNRPPASGRGVGPVNMPPNLSPYNFMDVSVSRELVATGGNLQLAVNGGNSVLHFNTLQDLSRREFRYGMQPVLVALSQPFTAEPYVGSASSIYNLGRTLRAYPLSHVDSTAANANPLPFLHDYYRGRPTATRTIPTTPATPNASLLESWRGTPTLAESAHPNYPVWLPGAVDTLAATVNLTLDPNNPAELQAYPVTGGQRADDDVFLRNVISWDVKVLETMGGYKGDDSTINTDEAVAPQAAGSLDNAQFHDYGTYGFTPPPGDVNLAAVLQRRSQFVDLGYGADETNALTPAGGNDAVAAQVNVLTLANYLFGAVPAPTLPPSFTIGAVTYTYNAPAYSVAGLGLTGAPFGYGWPAAGPQKFGGIANLLRGAYSPRSAPFGVDLDARFWVAGDVNDTSRQSDVYFGPDGKPGIANYADLGNHSGPADGGVLENPTGAPQPGEFTAPRSDDLPIDVTFGNPAFANVALANRPGVGGADMALGERGNPDDYVTTAAPDARDKPYPNAAGTQYSLGELFAPGSDDVPWVGVPFKLSGQVAANVNTLGGPKFHPFNLFNLNPRNTYDSWSAAPDMVSGYTGGVILPGYKSSPVRQHQVFDLTWAPPTAAPPPATAIEQSYIPEPDFRPVPYARPLKGIQVKIRVLEPRTGIVREATVRHYFGPVSE